MISVIMRDISHFFTCPCPVVKRGDKGRYHTQKQQSSGRGLNLSVTLEIILRFSCPVNCVIGGFEAVRIQTLKLGHRIRAAVKP